MFDIQIERWVPKFILRDRNGYALAKAIEAGLAAMNAAALQGLECVTDCEAMPEWRLDEMAWELDCLYNYGASVESKRAWIRNAIADYRQIGTAAAVKQYLAGYFDRVVLEEGNPYYSTGHCYFRILVDGEWSAEKETIALRMVEESKNVRSVLGELVPAAMFGIGIAFETEAVRSPVGQGG